MIPLMEQEIVDKRKWLNKEEFMDTMSLAQSMPGVFAVNMATNIGSNEGKELAEALLGCIKYNNTSCSFKDITIIFKSYNRTLGFSVFH